MLAMQRYPWEQGVSAQALFEAGRDEFWIPMARDAILRQSSDGRLAMIGGGAAVSDPAANGGVCLQAYHQTGDPVFLQGAERMLHYLMELAPRTKDGIICHNTVSYEDGFSPYQLWIDGMYMVPPFLSEMGKVKEAAEQIRGYIRHLYHEETGLFFHIVDTADHRYVRKKHWATGNGWAVMGLCRVAESAERQGYTEIREELVLFLRQLVSAMCKYQLEDGRFHDILDDPETFPEGTSAMMLSASIFRGIVNGYFSSAYKQAAETAYHTVRGKMDSTGLIHEVCGAPHFLREGTSAEAQAAFVMADAWRERCFRGENRKGKDE